MSLKYNICVNNKNGDIMDKILILIFRTAIIYLTITLGMRCMGKRQLGELSTAEISVTLLISEIAATPITELDVPLHYGITVVIILILCEIIVSYLDLKFSKVMRFTQGEPLVVVQNGKISEKALRKARVTVSELNEELRLKNTTIRDVYIAIIETDGQLSIIPKNQQNNSDPVDFAVVIDGEIKENNLKLIGKEKDFVFSIMKAKKITDLKDIFVMYADTKGLTYFQTKEKKK